MPQDSEDQLNAPPPTHTHTHRRCRAASVSSFYFSSGPQTDGRAGVNVSSTCRWAMCAEMIESRSQASACPPVLPSPGTKALTRLKAAARLFRSVYVCWDDGLSAHVAVNACRRADNEIGSGGTCLRRSPHDGFTALRPPAAAVAPKGRVQTKGNEQTFPVPRRR